MKPWIAKLKAVDACQEALDWLDTQPSLEAAWQVCVRGDWMEWLLNKRGWPEGVKSAYRAQRKPLDDSYRAQRKTLYDSYWAQRKPFYDSYRAQCADLLRTHVNFTDIGKRGAE